MKMRLHKFAFCFLFLFFFLCFFIGDTKTSSPSFCGTGLGSEGREEVLREREGVVGRTSRKLERKDEHEGRSGTDNMDDVSGNDQVAADNPPRKKRYHRHALQQIQEFEALLQECLHPGEKQGLRLRKRLCLETRQVKFWFQNRRTPCYSSSW
ncbi:hypothetical protein VitviT2T_014314 [Vitis vinifera]|uniref:Homeobox domain-containing protein n=2 Tax=Vitis vinifera TaxID=29760 RepID=A0ABY9CKG1_VITVI|nr:hypothetical protein VitviT2T_014313 [Vitis vinifera]WJZ95550.1 hypothetical protein VitviT2T_014314 [Vitis vinifera]